jgi:hypothetical protein
MIPYRPVAPLTPGHSGFVSALTAMALNAAVPGTSCQGLKEAPVASADTTKTVGNAYPVATGRKQP